MLIVEEHEYLNGLSNIIFSVSSYKSLSKKQLFRKKFSLQWLVQKKRGKLKGREELYKLKQKHPVRLIRALWSRSIHCRRRKNRRASDGLTGMLDILFRLLRQLHCVLTSISRLPWITSTIHCVSFKEKLVASECSQVPGGAESPASNLRHTVASHREDRNTGFSGHTYLNCLLSLFNLFWEITIEISISSISFSEKDWCMESNYHSSKPITDIQQSRNWKVQSR